ncbi:uncharacterized protein LOC142235887 [Haematobia irritans]|uniref:uncharacterized protein LOC142235887 n=1 Tax=Haematobia irritans TaxID=7368 RepID=UPI003F50726F
MDVDDMWFQQDGATCHTANETMALLRNKLNGRVISRNDDVNWPPRSCDLTPLDFFLWGYLKEKVYVDNPATIQELKDEIIRHINGIEPPLCLSVIENLEYRMKVHPYCLQMADKVFMKVNLRYIGQFPAKRCFEMIDTLAISVSHWAVRKNSNVMICERNVRLFMASVVSLGHFPDNVRHKGIDQTDHFILFANC